MAQLLRPLLSSLLLFSALFGFAYPAAVTALASLAFPSKAGGSVVLVGQEAVGSSLIGQPFTRPESFWGRPSATAPSAYNASASGGSNLGPLHPRLLKAIEARVEALRPFDPEHARPIPIDLVTASGSGLDPHISKEAAFYQVQRVARSRGLSEKAVRSLVEQHVEGLWPGVFDEPRVNVLLLNLDLKNMEQTGVE